MDPRFRLSKTMLSLAAAMTGTAAFLGWLDPSPSEPPLSPAFDDSLNVADSHGAISDPPRLGTGFDTQVVMTEPLASAHLTLLVDGADGLREISPPDRASRTVTLTIPELAPRGASVDLMALAGPSHTERVSWVQQEPSGVFRATAADEITPRSMMPAFRSPAVSAVANVDSTFFPILELSEMRKEAATVGASH